MKFLTNLCVLSVPRYRDAMSKQGNHPFCLQLTLCVVRICSYFFLSKGFRVLPKIFNNIVKLCYSTKKLLLYCYYFGPVVKESQSVIFICSINYPVVSVILFYCCTRKRNCTAVTLNQFSENINQFISSLYQKREVCLGSLNQF